MSVQTEVVPADFELTVVPESVDDGRQATVPTRSAPAAHRGSAARLRRRLVGTDIAAVLMGATSGAATSGSIAVVSVTAAVTVVAAVGLRLHRSAVCRDRVDELSRIAIAVVAGVAAGGLLGAAGVVALESATLAAQGATSLVALGLGRSAFRAWLAAARSRGRHVRPVVLVGTSGELAGPATFYEEHPELGYRVVGALSDDGTRLPGEVGWLGDLRSGRAEEVLGDADTAVIVLAGMPSRLANHLVRTATDRGTQVEIFTGLARLPRRRVRAVPLAHEVVHRIEPQRARREAACVKRAMDVVVAAVVLVTAAPILLLAALAIRFDDGGPVLFRQRRIGRDGEPFSLLKLRTMSTDAEERRAELLRANERDGPLFKLADDPRVTRTGRWLRDLSIDELPQLVNVLRGQMSLVGPRPALPEEIVAFDGELLDRHRVRPGMTGLWQVEARDKPSHYLYRTLDLFYVDSWTVTGDLLILARTAISIAGRLVRKVRPSPGLDRWRPTVRLRRVVATCRTRRDVFADGGAPIATEEV